MRIKLLPKPFNNSLSLSFDRGSGGELVTGMGWEGNVGGESHLHPLGNEMGC